MPFQFQVITLFPEMIEAAMGAGVFAQAQKIGLLSLSTINPRDFTSDVHRTVDDRPFGGGDGMIMMAEPLRKAIEHAQQQGADQPGKVIYLSPQGSPLTAAKSRALSQEKHLILLCGRYGGVDQRLLNTLVDEEISVGDFVVSGGELPACLLMDAVSRFVPGVLGHQDSAEKDSFSTGLLEHANFTRPRQAQGQAVPEILCSGNHSAIAAWKLNVSVLTTLSKRPELLRDWLQDSTCIATFSNARKLWSEMSVTERALLGLSSLTTSDFERILSDPKTEVGTASPKSFRGAP